MSIETQSWYNWWYYDPTNIEADPRQTHLKYMVCKQIEQSTLKLKKVDKNISFTSIIPLLHRSLPLKIPNKKRLKNRVK